MKLTILAACSFSLGLLAVELVPMICMPPLTHAYRPDDDIVFIIEFIYIIKQ